MAGYSYHRGMSNNAVAAYDRAVMPLSQFTAADLRAAGWTGTLKLARHLARAGVWPPSEWHHSGGTWFNEVDFYDAEALVDAWDGLDADEQAQHIAACKAPKAEAAGRRVKGRYAEWGGSRRRPRLLGYVEFTGLMIGNWIALDDGGRKKAGGNHITWSLDEQSA